MKKPAAGTDNKAQEAGAKAQQTTAQGEVKAEQPPAGSTPAKGPAAKGRQVKGPGVKHVVCQGPGNQQNYDQTGKLQWSALYKNGAKGTYKEDSRDEWSVYMSDDTAQIQLDLFLKKCTVKLVAGGTRINDVTQATR